MSSSDQFSAVQAWLFSLYGEERVPEFEINKETVPVLYELATASQHATSHANLALADANHQLKLYQSQSAELSNMLHSVGLMPSSDALKSKLTGSKGFDDPDRQVMSELAKLVVSLSMTLKLATTSASAIMEALGELDTGLFSIETKNKELSERKNQLTASYKETSELRQLLQKIAVNWDQSIAEGATSFQEQRQTLKYLESKSKEYSSTLEALKSTMKQNGANASIYHGNLQQLHEQLERAEAQNNEKQAQLEGFKQLPADATLAKLKIEEAAAYLLQLEDQISKMVTQLQIHTDI
jgi:DNA repair exonuclease SbcCD ATPase subunit